MSEGIQLKVTFKRVIMNEVLTTYLPTALLMIISHSTTFFPKERFEANLTVNLSVMLVMTTLFVSVMEKLPQTSYIRLVDIWLILGQLFPFLQVIFVTFLESRMQIPQNTIQVPTEMSSKVSVKNPNYLLDQDILKRSMVLIETLQKIEVLEDSQDRDIQNVNFFSK